VPGEGDTGLCCVPLVTFQAGEFFGFGLRAGECAGVGVLAGECDGGGVLAGDDFRDSVTLTFGALDFSPVRCCVSEGAVVGNGIAVGSSIAAGDLAGVAVAIGVAVVPGVGAPSGNSNRPRRCDTVDEGTGVCAIEVAISPAVRTDNEKYFRIPRALA